MALHPGLALNSLASSRGLDEEGGLGEALTVSRQMVPSIIRRRLTAVEP